MRDMCVCWEWGEVTWLKVKVDLKFFEMYLNARNQMLFSLDQ